jgi:hypothetical protein
VIAVRLLPYRLEMLIKCSAIHESREPVSGDHVSDDCVFKEALAI